MSDIDEDLRQEITQLKAKLDANADSQKQALSALEERISLRDEFVILATTAVSWKGANVPPVRRLASFGLPSFQRTEFASGEE
jgi:hypothetical protein